MSTVAKWMKGAGLSVDDIHIKTRLSVAAIYNWHSGKNLPGRLARKVLLENYPDFPVK
jgi:hypothetical protein